MTTAAKKKVMILVDICVSDDYILARHPVKGRWGTLQGEALRKARRLVDKQSNPGIGSITPMKEYGSIEISEDDFSIIQ